MKVALGWALTIIFASAQALASSSQSQRSPLEEEQRQRLKTIIAQSDSFQDKYEAQVWLVQKNNVLKQFVSDPDKRLKLLKEIHRAATRVGLPPEFVLAVIEVESHFDQFALSPSGAIGMMQIMPFWKYEIGSEKDNLIDIKTNLKYACTILKHYLEVADGDWKEALARYNGRLGKYKYPRKVLLAWEKHWR